MGCGFTHKVKLVHHNVKLKVRLVRFANYRTWGR